MNTLTQEEKDEQRLRQVEADIHEVMELMTKRTDRDQATLTLDTKRKQREEHLDNKEEVFHKHSGGTQIATTMHTRSHIELAAALKHRIQLGKYRLDLEESLKKLVNEQVTILERKLKLAKY